MTGGLASGAGELGGKGSRLHWLRDGGFDVPEFVVLGARHFRNHLEQDPRAQALLARLIDASDGAEKLQAAAELRGRINQWQVAPGASEIVTAAFSRLSGEGASLAVRSSATVEDGRQSAAAGMGSTFLSITTPELAVECVKAVWASLYSEAFVSGGLIDESTNMAVVLQQMVPEPRYSGILNSIDPVTGRVGFWVEGMPGLGSQIADGCETPDSWFVSREGLAVLEKNISVSAEQTPSDEMIRRLCSTTRSIRELFADPEIEVDVEFAFYQGRLFLLQVRPVTAYPTSAVTRIVRAMRQTPDECVRLRGIPVCPGAAQGPLQIVDSTAIATVINGAIVVTPHTDSEWNGVFPRIGGLITELGGSVSHPAVNAREHGTPAVVGAPGAVELLRMFDGRIVTFDALRGLVAPGAHPIVDYKSIELIWRDRKTAADIGPPADALTDSERFEQTRERLKALENYGEDTEGEWLGKPRTRPGRAYCPFQLSVYLSGWRLLNARFAALVPLAKPLADGYRIKDGSLWLPIRPDASHLVDHFGFSWPQLEKLLGDWQEVLDRVGGLLGSLEEINTDNVALVTDGFIELLSYMHSAFILKREIETAHADQHLRDVNDQHQQPLCRSAARQSRATDGAEAETPLSLQQMAAVAALALDYQPESEEWQARLATTAGRFKFGDERLAPFSPAAECAHDVEQLALTGVSVSLEQVRLLLDFTLPFSRRIKPEEVLESLSAEADGALRLVHEHSTRLGKAPIGVVGEVIDWYAESDDQASAIFRRYPNLQRTLSGLWQAQRLRDDSHHLAARWQRNLAACMVRISQTHFGDDDSVFQLDVREFDVLVRRGRLSMLVDTMKRRRLMGELENALDTEVGKADPIADEILGILAAQKRAARQINEPRLVEHYDREAAYVRRRMNSRMLQAETRP